jgi:hypothetical protein
MYVTYYLLLLHIYHKVIFRIINELLVDHNDQGWLGSQPNGQEGDQLLKLIAQLDLLMSDSLDFHLARGDLQQTAQPQMKFLHKLLGK